MVASFCSQDRQVNSTEDHIFVSLSKKKKKSSKVDRACVDFLFILSEELHNLPGNLSY